MTTASALEWRPGPKLRTLLDADLATAHMVRDELGGYGLTVRRYAMFRNTHPPTRCTMGRPILTAGNTAQEAADRMEERL